MINLESIAAEIAKIITFFGIQYTLGRRGSFPYGLLVKFSLKKICLLVVISDMIQTALLLNFLNFFLTRIKWLTKIKARFSKKPIKGEEKGGSRFRKLGVLGLFFIAALPHGGGALSGSILASSLQIEKKRAFLFIILGCSLGTLLYYFVFAGLLKIF